MMRLFNRSRKPRAKGDQVFYVCCLLTGIGAVQQDIVAAKPYWAAWRLLLFGVVIGGWRHWMRRLARWAELPPERLAFALSLRWRVGFYLLLFEIVVVQKGLVKITHYFSQLPGTIQ